ncbi:MAG: FecR domain-containing protein [Bdellovibrionales bacterium]|nr:FecR domain-containing protein [Bdellovibrionales bacterium]
MTRAKGEVDVLRQKTNESSDVRVALRAKENFDILCNDVIVTGKSSRAKLQLRGRGAIAMGPFARIEVMGGSMKKAESTANEAQALKLFYGRVRALVEKESSTPEATDKNKTTKTKKNLSYRFRIQTPSAVAGVRGTDFFVSYDPNTAVTEQATIEGLVDVQRFADQQKVSVKSGYQVTIAKDIEPAPSATPQSSSQETSQLTAVPIVPQILEEIRKTSTHVQKDPEFTSAKAVELLGKPETWTPPPDELALDLKNIKEEF